MKKLKKSIGYFFCEIDWEIYSIKILFEHFNSISIPVNKPSQFA